MAYSLKSLKFIHSKSTQIMRKLLLFFFALGISANALAQKPNAESLMAQQQKRFDAMIGLDPKGLDYYIHKDLYYCHSNALIDDKDSYIKSILTKATIYHKIDIEENRARIYGNTGILTGILNVINIKDGQELPVNRIRFTGVYLWEGGRWQLVSWQTTRNPRT